MKITVCTLLALAWLGAAARADVVILKHGDRVTGTLVNVKEGNLELKSDVLGDLTVPVKEMASFSAGKLAVVLVKGQKPIHGQLELEPSGNWQVTENGKSQSLPAASVDLIMPAEAYETLVERTAKPWQEWKGSVSLGYSIQHGNQQTSTFTTTVGAVRERPETPRFARHGRTNYTLTTLLSHASQDDSFVTSRTLSSNLRQDYLFTADNFVFGFGQFDHVSTEGLYLRQTYGGGYGRDLVKTSRTTFSLLDGLDFVHEKFFTGANDQNAEALAGEKRACRLRSGCGSTTIRISIRTCPAAGSTASIPAPPSRPSSVIAFR